MNLRKLCLIALGLPFSASALTEAEFLSAIDMVEYELPTTNNARWRFTGEKLENLDDKSKLKGTLSTEIIQPGVIKATYNNGVQIWVVFSDEQKSFVAIWADEVYEFEETPQEMEFKFFNHPTWERLKVTGEVTIDALDAGGNSAETMTRFNFHTNGFGTTHPKTRTAYFIPSIEGGGWWLEGANLSAGLQKELAGPFRTTLRTSLDPVNKRMTQFARWFDKAGLEQTAKAQEDYAAYFVSHRYRGKPEVVMTAYKDMGLLRGFERSYEEAPRLHAKAFAVGQSDFTEEPFKLHDVGLHYARSLNSRGDFEDAKDVLRQLYPTLDAAISEKSYVRFRYNQAAGEAEFGLKNYVGAEKWFAESALAMKAEDNYGSEIVAVLDKLSCQLAQGNRTAAAESLKEAIASHEARRAAFPKATIDTYELSFACSAMEDWENALKYAPKSNRRGSILYQEYARLIALLGKGDTKQAESFATELVGRFKDTSDINIRRDLDASLVALMDATSEMTPAAVQSLESIWSDQVENLRLRPLENYLFARNIVTCIQRLKATVGA